MSHETLLHKAPAPPHFEPVLPLVGASKLRDVDLFLCRLYQYWRNGGWKRHLANHILEIAALTVTVTLSYVLFLRINWRVVFTQCSGTPPDLQKEGGVGCSWSDVAVGWGGPTSSAWHRFCLLQARLFWLLLLIYLLWSLAACIIDIRKTRSLQSSLLSRHLNIPSDEALQLLRWQELLFLFGEAQKSTAPLSVLDMSRCLTRYDDYLTYLARNGILARHLPSWCPPQFLFTRHSLCNLQTAIFSQLFREDSFSLRSPFMEDPAICFPDNEREGVGPTLKNQAALLHFRAYNEARHATRKRLDHAATETIPEYFGSLPPRSPVGVTGDVLTRLLRYLAVTLLAILLGIALINEAPLYNMQLGGRHLLWYSVALGTILTFLQNFGRGGGLSYPSKGASAKGAVVALLASVRNTRPQWNDRHFKGTTTRLCDSTLCTRLMLTASKLFANLQWSPPSWQRLAVRSGSGGGTTSPLFIGPRHLRVQSELRWSFLLTEAENTLTNLGAVLLSPLLLLWYLPKGAPDICASLRKATSRSTSAGPICSPADADLSGAADADAAKSLLNFILDCGDSDPVLCGGGASPSGSKSEVRKIWGIPTTTATLLMERIRAFQKEQLNTENSFLCTWLPTPLTLPLPSLSELSPLESPLENKMSWMFWFDEAHGYSDVILHLRAMWARSLPRQPLLDTLDSSPDGKENEETTAMCLPTPLQAREAWSPSAD